MTGRPRAAWVVFGLYAGALFVATHWPRLAIDSPVVGTDKIIHAAVFCVWTVLLARAMRVSSGRVNLARLTMISVAYACIDEGLQAIPALGRTCSVVDLGANVVGIGLGVAYTTLRGRAHSAQSIEEISAA